MHPLQRRRGSSFSQVKPGLDWRFNRSWAAPIGTSPGIIASGPIAAYPLNEGNGTAVYGTRGRPDFEPVGTMKAGTAWNGSGGGRIGPTISWDGTSTPAGGSLSIDGASTVFLPTPAAASFTLSAWVYLRNFSNQTAPRILSLRSAVGFPFFLGFSNITGSPGYNGIFFGDGIVAAAGYGRQYTNTTAITGSWAHVCLVYLGTASGGAGQCVNTDYTLYENGIVKSTVASGAVSGFDHINVIGSAVQSANAIAPWDGYIENVLIFNSTLNSAQVWGLYTQPWIWMEQAKTRRALIATPSIASNWWPLSRRGSWEDIPDDWDD